MNDPVCTTCSDTHRMWLGEEDDRMVMCTHCPTPCQRCGNGPYCETTPCPCKCHGDRFASRFELQFHTGEMITHSHESLEDVRVKARAEERTKLLGEFSRFFERYPRASAKYAAAGMLLVAKLRGQGHG